MQNKHSTRSVLTTESYVTDKFIITLAPKEIKYSFRVGIKNIDW